jgi:hypothetical protein
LLWILQASSLLYDRQANEMQELPTKGMLASCQKRKPPVLEAARGNEAKEESKKASY